MLFFFRKLVEALLLPIGLSGLLVLIGIIFRRRWVAIAGVITLYVLSTSLAAVPMISALENLYPQQTVAACPQADAVVVLSGDIVRGMAVPGVQWGENANRYFTGLDLALAGKGRLFVISAGTPRNRPGPTDGSILREDAIQAGVGRERIVLTRAVWTTEDEAKAIANMQGIRSIVLVTSAFHMARAAMLFRATGLEVVPFPTDQMFIGVFKPNLVGLIPRSNSLRMSEEAMLEFYGLAVYRTKLHFDKPRQTRH